MHFKKFGKGWRKKLRSGSVPGDTKRVPKACPSYPLAHEVLGGPSLCALRRLPGGRRGGFPVRSLYPILSGCKPPVKFCCHYKITILVPHKIFGKVEYRLAKITKEIRAFLVIIA